MFSSGIDNFLTYEPRGGYPEVVADIDLSNSDEATHSPVSDAPANPKVLTTDDAANIGAIPAEAISPGSIGIGAPNPHRPPVSDSVPIVPPTGGCGRKCPHITAWWSNTIPHADQVLTQVKLPPYHRPRSPLDLVAIEIVFRRVFEVF
jgi:hypothetical protein